ncbi:MAG: hypothetical protein GWO12_17230, partial [Gemmatimonadetes bacterium]|nr:hypothetical protein [Candidatus Kutchimonas denitrificans]
WENPTTLLPGLVTNTLHSAQPATVTLECLSELRLLSIANGDHAQPDVSPEHARHFLTQVLALNLGWVFGSLDEAQRIRLGALADAVTGHLRYLMDRIGIDSILSVLVDEIRRILAQRPIKVDHVR